MSQKISPLAALAIIVVVIAVAAFAWFRIEAKNAGGSLAGNQPPGMPPEVAAEFQKRQANMTGPKTNAGPSLGPTTAPPTTR